MKKVIAGRVYDTKTATRICNLPCDTYNRNDFRWHHTTLYRSPKGTFFLAGEGGPMSMWAESLEGGRSYSGGSGLRVSDDDEARMYAEEAGLGPDEMEAAGFEIEEG
jgi:hypothetical protein